jgi:hypothetical protein
VKEVSELVLDLLSQIVQLSNDLLFWEGWVNELHLLKIQNDIFVEGLLDESHGKFLLRLLGLLEYLAAVLVVDDDALQHTDSLV